MTALLVAGLVPASTHLPPAAATIPELEQGGPEEQGQAGRPVVVPNEDGTMTMFVRRADGQLLRQDRNESGYWGGWVDTGIAIHGDPAVSRNLNGGLMVFVRNTNNRLRYQVQRPDGTWGGWQGLATPANATEGAVLDSNPAVAVNDNRAYYAEAQGLHGEILDNTDSRTEVFIRDRQGRLWHRAQRRSDGTAWTPWREIPFEGTFTGNPVTAVAGDGRISVFSRDRGGFVRHSAQVRPGRPGLGAQPQAQWAQFQRITTAANVRDGEDIAVAVNTVEDHGTLLQVFAQGSNDRLWTTTQRTAGTEDNPRGRWRSPIVLRRAFTTSPEVAAAADGRLYVYGARASDARVAYLSQQHPVTMTADGSTNYPHGQWYRCCDQVTGGPGIRHLTAVENVEGRIELFGTRRSDDSVFFNRQVNVGNSHAPQGSWREWVNLNPPAEPCLNAGSLRCFVMNVPAHGTYVHGRVYDDDVVRHAPPQHGSLSDPFWQVVSLDNGTFHIRNPTTDRCLDTPDWDTTFELLVTTDTCQRDRMEQRWAVLPVPPENEKGPVTQFRLESLRYPGFCLSAYDPAGESGPKMWVWSCDEKESHLLLQGRQSGATPGMLDLAIEYAAARCVDEPGDCRFVEDPEQTGQAYIRDGCVGSTVVYNSSKDSDAALKTSWERSHGTELSISSTMSVGFFDLLETSLTVENTWVESETEREEVDLTVPPRSFGWAERALVMKEVGGHWEFTSDGHTWTVPGQAVAYAKSVDNVKVGAIVTVTSPSPPTKARC